MVKHNKIAGILGIFLVIPSSFILFELFLSSKRFPYWQWLVFENGGVVFLGLMGGLVLAITGKRAYILSIPVVVIFVRGMSMVISYLIYHVYQGKVMPIAGVVVAIYELAIISIIVIILLRDRNEHRGVPQRSRDVQN